MSCPFPICPTPTPDSREAFLRTIWSNGLRWCGVGGKEVSAHPQLIKDARQTTGWTHSLYVGSQNTMFLNADEAAEYLSSHRTLVNSPRHFVEYIKRTKQSLA